MRTLGTAQAQKPVGEDTALEKGVELVLDELRQRRAGPRLDLGQEGVEVRLDELIERGVLGAPAFIVNRVVFWRALNRLTQRALM